MAKKINNWTYYEVRTLEGELRFMVRYDRNDNDKFQSLGVDGVWRTDEDKFFLDKLVYGEPDFNRLDGIPDWAYDTHGNLIP
jgi:hypothetical protein